MQSSAKVIKTGGICLIILALASATVGIIDAIWFSYPLQAELPLHAAIAFTFVGNNGLREMMTIGCLVPLLFIPGSLGIYYYLKSHAKGTMLIAHYFILVAMLCWMLNDMLWPAFNWYIAQYQYQEPVSGMVLLMISGLNALVHVYIGEYLRLTCLGIWLFLVSTIAMRAKKLPDWLCWLGIVFAVILWIAILYRLFVAYPLMIEHGFNYLPLVNFWIFIVGAVLVSHSNKMVENKE